MASEQPKYKNMKQNNTKTDNLDNDHSTGSQIRELALRLVHSGYQAGHDDTVEGVFSDDIHGTDSEYIHGERVDEIIEDFFSNT